MKKQLAASRAVSAIGLALGNYASLWQLGRIHTCLVAAAYEHERLLMGHLQVYVVEQVSAANNAIPVICPSSPSTPLERNLSNAESVTPTCSP